MPLVIVIVVLALIVRYGDRCATNGTVPGRVRAFDLDIVGACAAPVAFSRKHHRQRTSHLDVARRDMLVGGYTSDAESRGCRWIFGGGGGHRDRYRDELMVGGP